MKKFLALLGVLALLLSASVVLAEQNGLYVAPKFVYSYQRIDNTELKIDVDGLFSDSQDLDDEKDSAFGGALAFGYDFNPNFQVPVRVELEYAIRSESEGDYSSSFTEDSVLIRESGTFKFVVQSVFLNAYYDIDTGTPFTPYIGGGLGIAIIDADGKLKVSEDGTGVYDESASNTETNFAFNLAAGVGYDVNEALTLDLGYRYADFGNAESGDVGFDDVEIKGKAHLKAHEVLFGLRYTF